MGDDPGQPGDRDHANQTAITGPNSLRRTGAVVLDREQRSDHRDVIGWTSDPGGAATLRPSTAESTEIAGVINPSLKGGLIVWGCWGWRCSRRRDDHPGDLGALGSGGPQVAAPGLGSLVIPITIAVVAALFSIQHYGTGAVGRLFGPVMAVWFAVIAIAGLARIVAHPAIVKALSPSYGVKFFTAHPGIAFISLGSIVLTITGAEALYADMGHFGRKPISRAWFFVVFPALTLNYMGQGS